MSTTKIWKLSANESELMKGMGPASLDAATAQLPEGLYTTFRTYKGGRCAVGFKTHLRRLYQPSSALGIRRVLQPRILRLRIAELLSSNKESRVRLILSRAGDFYAIIEPLVPLADEVYERGVSAMTLEGHRQEPSLKLTGFIAASQAERESVREARVFEGLLVYNGRILEGLTSNFFYVCKKTVGTSKFGVLPGVTRGMVLRILREATFHVSYRALRKDNLSEIDEAFITSSSRGVVPIVRIDRQRIGSGLVGPLTKQLIQSFAAKLESLAEPINGGRAGFKIDN